MTDQPASMADLSVSELMEALASSMPTPGGGSAAALAGALGASLVAMVARLSQGRPRYAAHAELHAEAISKADRARIRFLELAGEDATAYAAYQAARRLPHDTEREATDRAEASAAAARRATSVPLAAVQECHHVIAIAERLVGRSNTSAASDLDVAALLLESAARGSAANVLVNLPAVGDETFGAGVTAEVQERLLQIQGAAARVHEQIGTGQVETVTA